jgi:uncharacterized NAD-dependent epimerase/dehydratase family protein
MIATPYLLYLGHSNDPAGIKTSRGLAVFRPEVCVGEFRHDDSGLTLGLKRMDFAAGVTAGARTLVLGIANAGGKLGEDLILDAIAAMEAGLDIASGLHQRLKDEPRLVATAQRLGRTLHDVRDPRSDIPVGNGRKRAGNRLLTVGTDCSIGKMYATLCLTQGLRTRGIAADFRATGQTGILIAGDGVPLDAVVADFIAGAIEQLSPERTDGGWDLIEGQGSIFNPAYAAVSLGLLHGSQPDVFVVCHDPSRTVILGMESFALPTVEEVIDLTIRLGSRTNPAIRCGGVSLNTAHLEESAALRLLASESDRLGCAVADPIRGGTSFDRLVEDCLA